MEEEIISNSSNSGKGNELNEALIKFNSVKHKVQNGIPHVVEDVSRVSFLV